MDRRRLPLFLVTTLLLSSCASNDEWSLADALQGADLAIIGGQETSDWPAVGAYVIDGGYGGMCTATLVTPDVAVTAAHCAELSGPNDQFYVGYDLFSATQADLFSISEAIVHPDYDAYSQNPRDVAVLLLDEPLTSVDPIPLNETPMTNSWIGDWFHYVGFGVDDQYGGNNSGYKRETDIQVNEVYNLEYIHYTPGTNTCSGDSGGPGLADLDGQWYVAGINSSVFPVQGGQDACHGAGYQMRVDAEMTFFNQYVQSTGDDDDDTADDDDTVGDDDTGDDDTADDDDAVDDDDTPAGDDDEPIVLTGEGCQCTAPGSSPTGSMGLALGALAFMLVRLRRRC